MDYRTSGFPSALFNGHLTAQNSDVRAGNNYQGHLQRWASPAGGATYLGFRYCMMLDLHLIRERHHVSPG